MEEKLMGEENPPSVWSSHQNFFHQLRTSKNLPSVWPPTEFLPSNEEKVYWSSPGNIIEYAVNPHKNYLGT